MKSEKGFYPVILPAQNRKRQSIPDRIRFAFFCLFTYFAYFNYHGLYFQKQEMSDCCSVCHRYSFLLCFQQTNMLLIQGLSCLF